MWPVAVARSWLVGALSASMNVWRTRDATRAGLTPPAAETPIRQIQGRLKES